MDVQPASGGTGFLDLRGFPGPEPRPEDHRGQEEVVVGETRSDGVERQPDEEDDLNLDALFNPPAGPPAPGDGVESGSTPMSEARAESERDARRA